MLNPESGPALGSPWWRDLNEALLRDVCEAWAIAFGRPGQPRTAGVSATLDFIREPTVRHWYRAHNLSIAAAYLANEDLARQETLVERFFINLVLVRVMYAHALVAQPKLALGWLAPTGQMLGDPRLGMTAMFLSLSRVLPDTYPLNADLHQYVAAEHSFGHFLDIGIIMPRVVHLYTWSADELELPQLTGLLAPGSTPAYAWDPKTPPCGNRTRRDWREQLSAQCQLGRRETASHHACGTRQRPCAWTPLSRVRHCPVFTGLLLGSAGNGCSARHRWCRPVPSTTHIPRAGQPSTARAQRPTWLWPGGASS